MRLIFLLKPIAFYTVFFLVVISSFASSASASSTQIPPARAVVVVQVRGEECCDKGTLDQFKKAVQLFKSKKIPVYFALRYDVLTDSQFSSFIKSQANTPDVTWGAFLEVTPNLARDSQVQYTGSLETWHQAQHSMLIGYSPQDRVKILTQYLEKYKSILGQYPEFSSGWMIDTPSLNLLSNKYGVSFHQITREQWGTDSYTLHGGPPHYPYPPSEKWLFEPDYGLNRPLLIIRQTVTDPLRNYADQSSAFTSQPNDYSRDGKKFNYFKDLILQAVSGQAEGQKGFVCLGLETSMDGKYWQELEDQLNFLLELRSENKVLFPSKLELLEQYLKPQLSIYQGKDLTQNSGSSAYWITSNRYRIRVRKEAKKVFISDIRIYDKEVPDPYEENVASDKGWWIVPFTLDSSRSTVQTDHRNWLQKQLGKAPDQNIFNLPSSDIPSSLSRIELPDAETDISTALKDSIISLSYHTKDSQKFMMEFATDHITYPPQTVLKPIVPENDLLSSTLSKTGINFSLTQNLKTEKNNLDNYTKTSYDCENQHCKMTFELHPELTTLVRKELYPIYFPERSTRELDTQKTTLYAHNKHAVAGKNPVRLVFIPKDKYGFSVKTTALQVATDPAIDLINPTVDPVTDYQFIDLINTNSLKTTVTLTLPGWSHTEEVVFAPNCKKDWLYCLTHPLEAISYLQAIIGNWYRKLLLNESQ